MNLYFTNDANGGEGFQSTVLSTSLGKMFFFLFVFFFLAILNECSDLPYLIRNHLSFLFPCFIRNIYSKSNNTAFNWTDLFNFNSKVMFSNFRLRKWFLLFFLLFFIYFLFLFHFILFIYSFFFTEFELLMFHTNIVKMSEK